MSLLPVEAQTTRAKKTARSSSLVPPGLEGTRFPDWQVRHVLNQETHSQVQPLHGVFGRVSRKFRAKPYNIETSLVTLSSCCLA